jgi:glycerophosphoryl diester phosphodiesterase
MYNAEITQKLAEINIPIWLDTLGDEDNSPTWNLAIKLGIKALQSDKPQELIAFLQKNNIR